MRKATVGINHTVTRSNLQVVLYGDVVTRGRRLLKCRYRLVNWVIDVLFGADLPILVEKYECQNIFHQVGLFWQW